MEQEQKAGADQALAANGSAKPGLIYKAMLGVQRDVDAVGKDSQNKDQGFKYRSIDAVYNAVHEAFVKNGVFTTVTRLERKDSERKTNKGYTQYHVVITWRVRFFAEDGSFVDAELDGEGQDSGDKASNKSVSYAHKYAILTALSIPTEDMAEGDRENIEQRNEGYREPAPKKAPQAAQGAKAPAGKPPVAPKGAAPATGKPGALKLLGGPVGSGAYVMPDGRFKNKRLEEIDPAELEEYTTTLLKSFGEKKKAPTGYSKQMIESAMQYLASISPPPAESDPEPGSFEDFQG